MTSLRGKGIFAVLAICAALLVPSIATAESNSYSTSATGSSSLERRAPFSISFTSLTRNGHIVAVKKFKFKNFKITCGGNPGSLNGRAPRMNVNHREFRSVIHKKGVRVYVKGQFRNHGQKVNGQLRAAGKFGSAKCTGKRAFRASQN